jgi:RNA polymerase primary sigma factor
VLLPTDFVVESLGAEDRRVLQRLMTEPQSYIPSPLFDQPGAEQELFGRRARETRIPSSGRSTAIPTLGAAEEKLLFNRYNFARLRVCQIIEAHAGRRLSNKAARELLQWGRRALQLRADIIQFNVPLVLSMAKRSRLSGLDFNEMVSEGNFALMRSVEKFDASRGFKFSTYACRAILKSFSRVAMKLGRYRGLFPVELNTELEKGDFVESRRQTMEQDCLEELRQILASNLADLTDVERTVIRERFALGTADVQRTSKTLEQVGAMIGVTKERVRQIQNKALDKIRHTLEQQILAA